MSIVVVGGGLAALRTVENLRANGWGGEIVVLSDEPDMPYNRPPLSKDLLAGHIRRDELAYALSDNLADVQWRLSCRVVSSDLTEQTLTLDTGERVPYAALVVATGVRSRRLALSGPHAGRRVLRTLADADALRAELKPGARIVVLGAGFIGCEVAATARALGCEVDVVAIDPYAMRMPLGDLLGPEMQRRQEAQGIRFHMNRTAVSVAGQDRLEAVVLDDGTRIAADFLVESVGSIPNTEWLDGNGLDLSNGVLCDEHLRAIGSARVVAVGDVARFANPLFGASPQRIEHWQTAIDTAAIAARTLLHDLDVMAEAPPSLGIMPWFWSDQGAVSLVSYGMIGLADRSRILEGDLNGSCAIAYERGDEVVGVALLDLKSRGAWYKRWLGTQRASVHATVG